MRTPVFFLGQSGWKVQFPQLNIYIDPYLSNSVQELESNDLKRLRPIPIDPECVNDADYVLITHLHIDHCDPHSIPEISKASPSAKFMGPLSVIDQLVEWGISRERTLVAPEIWFSLDPYRLKVRAVPAAHPKIERDFNGNLKCVGFLLEFDGKRIYFAGDTCVEQEIIDSVAADGPINTAVLPVNEQNYYRARRGILGNMSVREAFQFAKDVGAKTLVPVHWDMFEANSVFPDEIRLLHSLINPGFALSFNPNHFNLGDIDISVIIRTFNEEKYLEELLTSIKLQNTHGLKVEIVLVDSGSTDRTLEIAQRNGCHVEKIEKNKFSFGGSLNRGCRAAAGDFLAIISGHCIPKDENWLFELCQPLIEEQAHYTYGRQLGGAKNHFSEQQIFRKNFPNQSQVPQEEGFFCNNANSAIRKDVWMNQKFDEDLTGLEDMEMAQRIVATGGKIAYVATAQVYHHHQESWSQIRRRFKREALALRKIMPQVQVSLWDTLRYIILSCFGDWRSKSETNHSSKKLSKIILYRWNQYIGTWLGNHDHRKITKMEKEKYFYPVKQT